MINVADEVKQQQVPYTMLVIAVLAAVLLFKAPEIIKAVKGGGGDGPAPTPSGKLFADAHCAEYFAESAKHVAKIIAADGDSKSPKLTKNEDVLETLPGAFLRSALLGELHDSNVPKLQKFIDDQMDESGLPKAGALTAENRAKVVAAWEAMAAAALEAAK